MTRQWEIIESNKSGLNSEVKAIVVSEGVVFLRIVGDGKKCTLMTATMGEDRGSPRACPDQIRLIAAAVNLHAKYGAASGVSQDWQNRFYVKIHDQLEDMDAVNRCVTEFFEVLDGFVSGPVTPAKQTPAGSNDLRELYDALAVDDVGHDVYLSDGVWLGSDGSTIDRGR
jgi:hypothetical protein